MRKVLLLNPPGRLRYIRDQFCSHVSKGHYYWQPLDLLLLSGRLHAAGHELAVVDAIAEGLGIDAALARITRFRPDALVFLTGSDSFDDDLRFVQQAKRAGVESAVGIGDILRAGGPRLLEDHPSIDASLNDFVTHGLATFLAGRPEDAENMTVRTPEGVRVVADRSASKRFRMPAPRYELFPLRRYRLPFNRYHPYATVVASAWCPFPCAFCPFASSSYRVRDVDDTLANLEEVRRLGICQVHFADWTFAVNRVQTVALLEGMRQAGFRFSWSCLSRVDLVDRELLGLFKQTGCHLVEFGVESGSQTLLDRYNKRITLDQVRRAFKAARDLDLATLATFILGLPGETRESVQATLDLALEIAPAYCSFNVASPRFGTALRRDMLQAGLLSAGDTAPLDSSWAPPSFSTDTLSAAELDRFRRHANRRFYFRPSYLVDRLRRIGTIGELRNQLINGAAVAWRALGTGATRQPEA